MFHCLERAKEPSVDLLATFSINNNVSEGPVVFLSGCLLFCLSLCEKVCCTVDKVEIIWAETLGGGGGLQPNTILTVFIFSLPDSQHANTRRKEVSA